MQMPASFPNNEQERCYIETASPTGKSRANRLHYCGQAVTNFTVLAKEEFKIPHNGDESYGCSWNRIQGNRNKQPPLNGPKGTPSDTLHPLTRPEPGLEADETLAVSQNVNNDRNLSIPDAQSQTGPKLQKISSGMDSRQDHGGLT